MRAMVYRRYGGPLEPAELPDPTPGAGQLLVRVRHASVNPVDWKVHSGAYRLLMPAKFPVVPGYDVAGEVVALGAGVGGFSVGDRVHARIAGLAGGACAELARVGVDVATRVPDGMNLADAAALPLAGITALQALRDGAGLPLEGARESVLVVGASGGVGHLGLQIARAAGARVTGVCSTRNVALVRELGADDVIDYTQPGAWDGRGPWDVVLDCVGTDYATWLPRTSARGRYATTTPGPGAIARSLLNAVSPRRVAPVMLKTNAPDLRVLDGLYAAGKLRVVVDGHHPLDRLTDAWERSKSGRATGKIVIDVA